MWTTCVLRLILVESTRFFILFCFSRRFNCSLRSQRKIRLGHKTQIPPVPPPFLCWYLYIFSSPCLKMAYTAKSNTRLGGLFWRSRYFPAYSRLFFAVRKHYPIRFSWLTWYCALNGSPKRTISSPIISAGKPSISLIKRRIHCAMFSLDVSFLCKYASSSGK